MNRRSCVAAASTFNNLPSPAQRLQNRRILISTPHSWMPILLGILVFASSALAQYSSQLSQEEINAALRTPTGSGFVYIEDSGFTTPSRCPAQMPSVSIYTPAGWLKSLSDSARKQFLTFKPGADATLRALTIISRGCASGTAAGPVCESISRTALLSDLRGTAVAEAVDKTSVSQSWQNGFGASAVCSSLASKFLMSDVQKVRNTNGEFLVATFSGSQLLKVYTVKEKHLKKLAIPDMSAVGIASLQPTTPPPPNPLLDGLNSNSEAAKASPAAAAALANTGHVTSSQENEELVKNGRASRCSVVTTPPGAVVEIDGNRMGVSPIVFYLLRHGDTPRTVTIKMGGYKTIEKKVIPDGKVIPIGVMLEKE